MTGLLYKVKPSSTAQSKCFFLFIMIDSLDKSEFNFLLSSYFFYVGEEEKQPSNIKCPPNYLSNKPISPILTIKTDHYIQSHCYIPHFSHYLNMNDK